MSDNKGVIQGSGNITGNGLMNQYYGTSIFFLGNFQADISTTVNGYAVYGFTQTGKTYSIPYAASGTTKMFAFVVAGGGAAGSIGSGGGGGGGVVMTHIDISTGSDVMSISVGAGGNNPYSSTGGAYDGPTYAGYDGSNSSISFEKNTSLNITATSGGKSNIKLGQDGSTGSAGSGGSGGGASGGSAGSVSISVGNNRTTCFYGYSGGTSNGDNMGGGGGAGAVGGNGTVSTSGNGGIGIKCTLPGIVNFSPYNTYYYGSGGGGGKNTLLAGSAGSWTGGGTGGTYTNPGLVSKSGENASNNTGGGGGGSAFGTNGRNWPSGGSGGSGIVFIAIPLQNSISVFSFLTTSPIMWLDAAVADSITFFSGTSNVSGWKDRMGNYNFGTIGGNGNYITYDTANKRIVSSSAKQQPSTRSEADINAGFSAILRCVLSSSITLSNGGTFYCVIQNNSSTWGQGSFTFSSDVTNPGNLYGYSNYSTLYISTLGNGRQGPLTITPPNGSQNFSNKAIYKATVTSSNVFTYQFITSLNNVTQVYNAGTRGIANTMMIGAGGFVSNGLYSYNTYIGYFHEFLMFNTLITEDEQNMIESYLISKWSL